MNNKQLIVIWITGVSLLSGCVGPTTLSELSLTKNDISGISVTNNEENVAKIGMTIEEVKSVIGEPTKSIKMDDTVKLYYYLKGFRWLGTFPPCIIPVGRNRYELIFKQNKLEKILLKTYECL